jgi:hypothetical protein
MRNYVILLLVVCFVNCGAAFASYDLILTGIQEYNTPVSYSNKTILITSSAYIIYDCNFILENCIIDVNGSVECNSNITLINSVIRTKGSFNVWPGITITETGASSIIATGDPQCTGKVNIEGELGKRITIISDYIPGSDAEFIIFDANASSDSSLKFTDFYGGWCNVQIYNKRLNDAISNCRFYGAKYAIWQDGIDELTDISFSLFYHNNTSIYFGIDGIYRTNVNPSIDNVVIDGNSSNSYGIVFAGGQNPSYLDYLKLTNSIITNCYCGWYIDVEQYFYPPNMSNIAYYGNEWDDNLGDSSFQKNPMYLTQSPFETPEDPNDWPYFINPESPVADVNLGYDIWQSAPEQMLTSLFKYPTPRANKGIGLGVPISSEYFSNAYNIEGDFDETGRVNFFDYSIFASEWQIVEPNSIHFPDANGYSIADFDHSGTVDILDFARFSNNWLSKSGVDLVIDDNENLLTVTCQSIQGPNVAYYAFFLDGKYIASRDSEESPTLIINKMKYPKGTHYLRAAIKTADGNEYLTADQQVSFNSPLHDLSFDELFDPSKQFCIKGKLNEGYSATIAIKDIDDQILWSNSYTGDFIATVDANIFSAGAVNYTVSYGYAPTVLGFAYDYSLLAKALLSSSSSASGESSILALGGPPSNICAGLILCMMEDGMKDGANWTDTGTCRFASKMMSQKQVKPIILRGYGGYNMVRRGMINQVFRKYPNIRYGHIYAHGNYESKGAGILGLKVRRTRLLFNDGEWVAFNSRKWLDKGQPVPAGYEYLSDTYENAHYLNQIPFSEGQLKILVIESCYALRNVVTIDGYGLCHYIIAQYDWELNNQINSSYAYGYPYSDICAGLNMTGNQFVLGGGDVVIKGGLYPYYSRLFNYFWSSLGNGDTTLDAWQHAYNESGMTVEVKYKHRWRGLGINVTLSGN